MPIPVPTSPPAQTPEWVEFFHNVAADSDIGTVNVQSWGAKADGVTDDTSAIAAAVAEWQSLTGGVLIFPPGTYNCSSFPNLCKAQGQIYGIGHAVLNHTGTGEPALTIDGGTGAAAVGYRMRVENLTINGNANSTHGLFIRNVHHSTFKNIRITGCSTSGYGIYTQWIICNVFDKPIVSSNEAAFTSTPLTGMYLHVSPYSNEYVSAYNTIICPIMEGVTNGISVDRAAGNLIFGGTLEANDYGIVCGPNSWGTEIIKCDFEANSTCDIYLEGNGHVARNCFTNKLISIYDYSHEIDGGVHAAIAIDAAATHNRISNLRYNINNDSSTISDSGAYNEIRFCRNYATGLFYQETAYAITPTGSPFDYVNYRGNPIQISVYGGTVSSIVILRSTSTLTMGPTSGSFIIYPMDTIRITYSSAPTIEGMVMQ